MCTPQTCGDCAAFRMTRHSARDVSSRLLDSSHTVVIEVREISDAGFLPCDVRKRRDGDSDFYFDNFDGLRADA